MHKHNMILFIDTVQKQQHTSWLLFSHQIYENRIKNLMCVEDYKLCRAVLFKLLSLLLVDKSIGAPDRSNIYAGSSN